MRRGNRGVKVLRKHENSITGIRVELTQKMTIAGRVIHAVVVTNMRSGRHTVIKAFDRIADAFGFYKDALA